MGPLCDCGIMGHYGATIGTMGLWGPSGDHGAIVRILDNCGIMGLCANGGTMGPLWGNGTMGQLYEFGAAVEL